MQASSSSSDNGLLPPIQDSAPSAKASLLLAGKLTPQEIRYYEGPHVSPNDLNAKLVSCIAALVGGIRYTSSVIPKLEALRHKDAGCQLEPCRYIPPRGWACFERAQRRLEVLKEVYPELTFCMQVMVEKVMPTSNRTPVHVIRWTEVVLGLEYDELLEIS